MDLLSPFSHWQHHDHDHDHGHTPKHGKLAFLMMWMTVLLPYLAIPLVAMAWWKGLIAGWCLMLFVGMYLFTGFGVTIGYHRLLAHRAFDTFRPLKGLFIVAGAMALQGPPIKWAATHRRHHQTSDREGDPHSPFIHEEKTLGRIKGFIHSHTGWLLTREPGNLNRSINDMASDPVIAAIDRTYYWWILLSALLPAAIGFACTGTAVGALVGVLWGFVLRIGLVHHATWSVNSICHLFGYRSFKTPDQSRNNIVIGVLALGEGWHNNHHAFPTSARHGLKWWEFDPSYVIIKSMAILRLVWNVRKPAASAIESRAAQVLEPTG